MKLTSRNRTGRDCLAVMKSSEEAAKADELSRAEMSERLFPTGLIAIRSLQ